MTGERFFRMRARRKESVGGAPMSGAFDRGRERHPPRYTKREMRYDDDAHSTCSESIDDSQVKWMM